LEAPFRPSRRRRNVLAANAALLLAYVAAGRLGLENGARGRLRDAAVPACQHGDGHRAHRDPLTGQGNRLPLNLRLDQAPRRQGADGDRGQFEKINDTAGTKLATRR
jgi:GGDEF domain-containing protein